VIVGRSRPIELLLVALMAEGHVLLEDVPGVAKTLLAKSLAKSYHQHLPKYFANRRYYVGTVWDFLIIT
jgi:MoxR-like ATPase